MLVTLEETEHLTLAFSYAGMGPTREERPFDAPFGQTMCFLCICLRVFTYSGLPVCDFRPRGPYFAFRVRSTPDGVWRPLFTVKGLRYRSLFLSFTYVTAS